MNLLGYELVRLTLAAILLSNMSNMSSMSVRIVSNICIRSISSSSSTVVRQ